MVFAASLQSPHRREACGILGWIRFASSRLEGGGREGLMDVERGRLCAHGLPYSGYHCPASVAYVLRFLPSHSLAFIGDAKMPYAQWFFKKLLWQVFDLPSFFIIHFASIRTCCVYSPCNSRQALDGLKRHSHRVRMYRSRMFLRQCTIRVEIGRVLIP